MRVPQPDEPQSDDTAAGAPQPDEPQAHEPQPDEPQDDEAQLRRRFGVWSLVLGIVGIFALLGPAYVVTVIVGGAISATAGVLGINGVLAIRGGQQDDRAMSITGIVLGGIGLFFWITAMIGVALGL